MLSNPIDGSIGVDPGDGDAVVGLSDEGVPPEALNELEGGLAEPEAVHPIPIDTTTAHARATVSRRIGGR
jgi:hypothetical protein